MSAIDGRNGAVKFATNLVAEITNFSFTETQVQHDKNSMSNPDWDESIGGRKAWTASVEVLYDPDDTNGQVALTTGVEGAFDFIPSGDTSGNTKYSGNGRVSDIEVGTPHDGLVTASFNVRGNGALTKGTVT